MARPSVREQIVEAASEQFHRHGYNACGVKLITDSAGVPKGSFYNHFASKEVLALEVMDRYGASRRIEELAEPSPAPLERLRLNFEFLAGEIVEHGYERGCVFGNFTTEAADHSEAIRDGARVAFENWSTSVAAVLREAQENGDLTTTHDPNVLALFIVNAWEGAIVGARAARNDSSFAAFFHTVFNTLLV